MKRELEGKTALITGGSSGIGATVSRKFGKEGANVAVVASSDINKAQKVVSQITDEGGEAKAFVCDVRKVSDIKNLVRNVIKSYGTIDILVAAAGIAEETVIGETKEDTYDRLADIDLKGLYFTVNEVVPIMKEKREGKIILFSSNVAFVGISHITVYCALKAGVAMLTRCLALSLARYNINVNAVAPGNTATPINEAVRTKPEFAERRALIDAQTPSNRSFSDPQEIAEMVFYLATERSRPMHGSVVLLDEGQSAGLMTP